MDRDLPANAGSTPRSLRGAPRTNQRRAAMTNDQQETTAGTTAVTTPSAREIVSERVFDAPRERGFAAYTDPALIPQWWGPRGTTTIGGQMDGRPGGPRRVR